ncbi:MAG: hydantoinase/carbamoylase family amidase, partial [Tissierella sp.]|uniref:hydantoinase/carbamoylase family amidase n=1 Tax=Tissierella sp. TaxID=41274 RepID=UPI003F9DF0BA
NGGKFDGILGVVVGLEALRHIVERKINHINPIELIVFVEEEGCNFGTPMVGSKTLTGIFNIEDLKRFKNDKEISVYDAAKKFGLKPDNIRKDVLKPNEIKAMIELHIEQSLVLEKNEISVGVIEKIAGVRRLEIEFEGVSNHAGATPMNLRYDPMAAASKVIASIDKIVEEKAFKTTVATVGKINCYPNAINVIPEKVIFTVDIRDINSQGIDIVENEIRSTIKYISNYYEIKSKIKITGEAPHINLSPKIISILQSSAKDQNIEYLNMNSGAAHDACILSTITDVGMLFVPSINGRSHAPEENTSYDDIEKGAKVLLEALVRLSN